MSDGVGLQDERLLAATGGGELGRIVYPSGEVTGRVEEMGREISGACPSGTELLVLGLLQGSFVFLADLVRRGGRPLRVDFLVASSYGLDHAEDFRHLPFIASI